MITHKLHGAVVGEQVLNADAPVLSGDQSTVGAMRLTQVADPRVQQLQGIKRPLTDKDVETVGAITSANVEEETRRTEVD